jgi:hypothetical protein
VINRLMLCCSVLISICCSPCFNKSSCLATEFVVSPLFCPGLFP